MTARMPMVLRMHRLRQLFNVSQVREQLGFFGKTNLNEGLRTTFLWTAKSGVTGGVAQQ
jgi:hypothetical protein